MSKESKILSGVMGALFVATTGLQLFLHRQALVVTVGSAQAVTSSEGNSVSNPRCNRDGVANRSC
jgi:hypothetical protein